MIFKRNSRKSDNHLYVYTAYMVSICAINSVVFIHINIHLKYTHTKSIRILPIVLTRTNTTDSCFEKTTGKIDK